MKITFLGAAGTVTGSKFLIDTQDLRILVDCGLFQGVKKVRERNWNPFPIDVGSIDAIVLTHAHIDHTGYLGALAASGYSGIPLFTPGALRAVRSASLGVARTVNILCHKALMVSWSRGERQVRRCHVRRAVSDTRSGGALPVRAGSHRGARRWRRLAPPDPHRTANPSGNRVQ